MHKNSQVTYFLLLGLTIMIAAAFIFYIFNANKIKESKIDQIPTELQPVNRFVNSCIKNIGKEGLVFIGKQGGYFDLPKPHNREFYTAYYFYLDRNLMPTISKIEDELAKYLTQKLPDCLKDFEELKKIGYQIEYTPVNITTKINSNSVLLNVNFPIKITIDQKTFNVKDFSETFEGINLFEIYQLSRVITEDSVKNPKKICFICIIKLSIQNNLITEFFKIDNESLLVVITDKKYQINNQNYEFIFSNKYKTYSCNNLPPEDIEFIIGCAQGKLKSYNYGLKINKIPNLKAKSGSEFYYEVNATGLNITFTDYTDLFDINKKTGEIKTIFGHDKIGNYTIWISAEDLLKNKAYEVFKLEII